MNITVKLTKAQALAILKSDGFKNVHYGYAHTNQKLDEASKRVLDAVQDAWNNEIEESK